MTNDFDHQMLARHDFGLVAPDKLHELPAGISVMPLVPDELVASAHLMPVLIELSTLQNRVADALLQQMYSAHVSDDHPPVQLFVTTNIDADAFARHWNALQLVSLSPGKRSWLRLHDPRVLHQLLRILERDQRRSLFGPTQAMTYWISGSWVKANAKNETADDRQEATPARNSKIIPGTSGWDWQRIGHISIVNRALHLAGVSGEVIDSHSRLAEHLIARARTRHGLTSAADLAEFSQRGLTARPGFDECPDIAVLIPPAPDAPDDSSLADRFALVDEERWNELRTPT